MGNTLVSPETQSDILNKYWQSLSKGLYINKATHEVIQQKKLAFRTEDEMKYVFNCLLKRMNNYHPSVIKIMYLRKMAQTSNLCDCGRKFVILVYVEHVAKRLKQFIREQNRMIDRQHVLNKVYDHRCACISLVKAALYLKQRYGAFRVTESNIWIDVSKSLNEVRAQQKSFNSPEGKADLPSTLKLKLWISSEQQQTFPDESCQQKQMVLSIIQLIQHTLAPSKLCKCYSSPQVLDNYRTVHKLNELADKIKQDHSKDNETLSISKTLSNVQIPNKQPVQFQRNIRSFSSNEPGKYPSNIQNTNNVALNDQNSQYAAQRKYTSIEYVRRQPIQYNSVVSEKKAPNPQQMTSQVHQFFSPNAKPLLMNQKPLKQHSFQFTHQKSHYNSVKNDHSLTKNQYKTMIKFQPPKQQAYQTETRSQSFIPPKTVQPFNPKIKFRHGNSIYNRPIIGIADISAQISTNIPSIAISSQPSQHLTPKQEKDYKSQSPSPSMDNQANSDRDSTIKQDSKISKINFDNELSKKHVEISLDKGTNPTDRSKIDISSKSQEKKQTEGVNTSRKNISLNPASLDSTNIAPEPLKTAVNSHTRKPTSTPASGELQMPNIKQSSIHQDKSKRQSAQNSQSEKNYITYQINLTTNSKTQQEIGKFFPRKKSSHVSENQASINYKGQKPGQASGHRQKSYSFVNKIQTLTVATPNGDIGRLRQSQYISSGKNSLLNSKSISVSDSQPLKVQKQLQSLEQMELKFPTLQNLQNYEDIGIQKSQSHLFFAQGSNNEQRPSKNASNILSQENQANEVSYTKIINLNSYQQSREQSIVSNNSNSHSRSGIQIKKSKKQSFISNISNPRAPIPTEQLQQIMNDKISSMNVKQYDEIAQMQKSAEDEYKVNGNEKQRMHHKKMSNPTFDKQYMKSKALKEEFGLLLGDPKENASRALTQSKDKMNNLESNEGRQTYSIYNQSEYNTSEQASKRQSQHQNINLTGSGSAHPPLPHKQSANNKQTKWRKPFSKQELEKELQQKKEMPSSPPNQQTLRLTSSGHEDNSIKQKVRNKKAQFAQLKNEMNSLLL